MKTRVELVDELASWRSIDTFTAKEDADYAREQIERLRKAISEIDLQNEPTHVCCKCKRTEDDTENFLGFHAFAGTWEICDNCAEVFGCQCCKDVSDTARENFWRNIGVEFA